jgi:hypothetical protein
MPPMSLLSNEAVRSTVYPFFVSGAASSSARSARPMIVSSSSPATLRHVIRSDE